MGIHAHHRDIISAMRIARISRGGQVSIPASVKRRWRAERVVIEDRGDELVVRPLPDDPIGAALSLFPAGGPTTDEIRAQLRDEEARAEERRGLGRT
jgi:bifunctional DNA-binding transcriptional regulator/antitoxin component of YhaV-PrlF toxin-antitoxin module